MATDASYIIDIAANLSGNATSGELDGLTASLLKLGRDSSQVQDAIAQVGKQLDAARASAVAANEALGAGNSRFAELEKAALKAAGAADKAAQKNGGVVPPELARRLSEAQTATNAYAVELGKLEKSAQAANDKEAQLTKTAKNLSTINGHVNKTLAENSEALEKIGGALGRVGGPLGKLGQGLIGGVKSNADLTKSLGGTKAAAILAAAGVAALAAAVIAAAAAFVYGAVKVAIWAVGLADAKRSAELATEAFNVMNPALAGLPFDDITAQTGQTAAELQGLAKQLQAAKVSAADMPAALRAAALAETALGKGGASEFVSQIQAGKKSVQELATATQQQLGGIVQRQMLSVGAQSATLQRNISEIFGGLNIDPVLDAMRTLVSLFDKNTAAGRALKFLFESVFQPIIDSARQAAYVVEAFYLGVLIGAVKLYIKLKPAIKTIKELLGLNDSTLEINFKSITKIGEALAPVLLAIGAAVGGVLLVAFGAVGALVAAQLAIWYGLIKVVGLVVSAFQAVIGAVQSAWSYLKSLDLAELGTQLMMGFVNGITGAAGAVVDAVKNAVGGAIKAAKSLLGIASPSKVFASIGDFTGQGFAQGVEGATPDAHAAVAAMASPEPALAAASSPADAGAAPAPAAAASAAGPSVTITGDIYFAGAKASDGEKRQLAEWLTLILEGDALAAGAT